VIDVPATGRERVAAGVLVGAAVLFAGFAIPRTASTGFFGALTLPLVLLAADLVIAAAVLTWWYPLRPVAQGLAVFGILVHALVMLRSGPLWTRGCSGVLLLAHSWALVQLFLMTAAEDDDFDDDYDDDDEPVTEPPPDLAPREPVEIVETPVTDVVDVAAPVEAAPEPPGDAQTGEPPEPTSGAGEAATTHAPENEAADADIDQAAPPWEDDADDEQDLQKDSEERIR